ncbi:hypothetical protein CLIM01_00238 [Colletotrichum limetticola]|uniref:Uncharacterized protein n=1 Tax=Colletotrichum limetticola TaxID=1209924 RepID=A0ABQ9QF19_9PEZI|nr:hypothetical protein CLIM01_00238 [Colletotrichum limetticola]
MYVLAYGDQQFAKSVLYCVDPRPPLPTSKNPTRRLRTHGPTLGPTQPQEKDDFDVFSRSESALTASYTFVLPHVGIPEYGPSAQPLSSEHASGRDANAEA